MIKTFEQVTKEVEDTILMAKDLQKPLVEKLDNDDPCLYRKAVHGVLVTIPSFTFKATVEVDKFKKEHLLSAGDPPINVKIDTFENNLERVLGKVVPAAVAEALEGKIPEELDADRRIQIGGHACVFPNSFSFHPKK